MSFIRSAFRPGGPLKSREQILRELIEVADELDMPDKRGAVIIGGMTVAQEAGDKSSDPEANVDWWCPWNSDDPQTRIDGLFDAQGDDGYSSGYFQQQSPPGRGSWWPGRGGEFGNPEGARCRMTLKCAAREFMSRLKKQPYRAGNATEANHWAQAIQGSGRPDAYAKHFGVVSRLYDQVAGAPQPGGTQVGWQGDPVWLPDVLRAEGLRCDIMDGAFDRGHGDMGDIWGVVCHHTGNDNASPESIAFHPELGLASQLWLGRDGRYVLCGVGIAWHAGSGSWPGLGTNNANPRTIAIEAACLPRQGAPHHEHWPDVMYDAYVRGVAAICRKVGKDSSHVLGHKDWAGPAQGKWDPGAIDMNIMRADIQRRIFPQPPGQLDPVLEMLAMPNNQEKLDFLYSTFNEPLPSTARYRSTNDPIGQLRQFLLWANGTGYDDYIESSAARGNQQSLELIEQLSRGEGPEGGNQESVEHAKDFLRQHGKGNL